jgi:methionine synthase I (cobalamin-dependent)
VLDSIALLEPICLNHLLSQNTSFNVSAHPNVDCPTLGEYDETPEQMQAFIKEYLDDNLGEISYGCCGTTPAHIINCRYCKGV